MPATHLLRPARVVQQPDWHSLDLLRDVLDELTSRSPLVEATDCRSLREQLAGAARGQSFVLQIGDCAERFDDAAAAVTRRKATQLHQLADRFEARSSLPVVRVGRIAGQYSKPRSSDTERVPGWGDLPVYRGDAVNDPRATPAHRIADPVRLLQAYDRSAEVLAALRTAGEPPVFTSHEALLLEFEEALMRTDADTGRRFGSSAHFLWVGNRTRQVDHAHVDFLASVDNPVAVKVGPTIVPGDAAALVRRLDPARQPGRLTVITRMGAAGVREHLGRVLTEVGHAAREILWMVDPMHGNTRVNLAGQKTRVVPELLDEIGTTAGVLAEHGCVLGGLHLETTPDAVTECVLDHTELMSAMALPDYRSACDPRLNPTQAATVVDLTASLS